MKSKTDHHPEEEIVPVDAIAAGHVTECREKNSELVEGCRGWIEAEALIVVCILDSE